MGSVEYHITSSEGTGLSNLMIKNIAKQVLFWLLQKDDTKHMINSFTGQLREISGDNSLLASEVTTWTEHIQDKETVYEESLSRDKLFLVKICYINDDRMDCYFRACCMGRVNSRLVSFLSFQKSIQNKAFDIKLPPEIRQLLKGKNDRHDNGSGQRKGAGCPKNSQEASNRNPGSALALTSGK